MSKFKNNKTVIHGSSIDVKGDLHIGDKVTNVYHQPIDNSTKIEEGINEIKEKTRQLIAKSKIKSVFELLLKETKGKDMQDELLQFSEQWNKLKKEERMGFLSSDEANRRNNLIVKGLLELVSEL